MKRVKKAIAGKNLSGILVGNVFAEMANDLNINLSPNNPDAFKIVLRHPVNGFKANVPYNVWKQTGSGNTEFIYNIKNGKKTVLGAIDILSETNIKSNIEIDGIRYKKEKVQGIARFSPLE